MHCPYKYHFYMNDFPAQYPSRAPQFPPPLTVKPKDLSYNKSYFIANLRIPVFYDSVSGKPVNYINSSVENDITEFKDQIEEGAKHDLLKPQDQGKPIKPYRASDVYEVTYNRNGILSMTVLYNILLGSLNHFVRTSYNYDTMTGKTLSLGDLFKPGVNYIQVLNNEIRRELSENSHNYSPSAVAKFPGITADQPFYLQDSTLVIFFGFNEVAPVAAEIPVVRIPFSRISGFLIPRVLR